MSDQEKWIPFSSSSNMIQNFFLQSVAVALTITGLAKILSILGTAEILERYEPILGFSFRLTFLIVGSLELGIAFFVFFSKRKVLSIILVGWLATVFTLYRLGLWFIGWQHPCHCLGELTSFLHISESFADMTMKYLIFYIFSGCFIFLFKKYFIYEK